MRAGKRKNADGKIRLVKETSKVSLIMPDGKEFQGKKREVDQKIMARMFGKNALWVNGVVTPAWMPIDQLSPKLAPS